jgi:hypothetical protein
MKLNLLFNQENDHFKSSDGIVVEVNSLCGSRSFVAFGHLDGFKRIKPQRADITIIRDESLRLLSAFNKKIVARDDWRKTALRRSIGINRTMDFNDFIEHLIERKLKEKFIDKHFKPCTGTGKKFTIDDIAESATLSKIFEHTFMFRIKSSSEVASKYDSYKSSLLTCDVELVRNYLSLYHA